MQNGTLLLEVFQDSNHPSRNFNPEVLGIKHFGLVIEDLDEALKGIDSLEGVECEEIRTNWFGKRFTFCRDYDGQRIELKEKKHK